MTPWFCSCCGEDQIAIWGLTGTGKTGLATVLLAEHLRTGQRWRWISGPELAHCLRQLASERRRKA